MQWRSIIIWSPVARKIWFQTQNSKVLPPQSLVIHTSGQQVLADSRTTGGAPRWRCLNPKPLASCLKTGKNDRYMGFYTHHKLMSRAPFHNESGSSLPKDLGGESDWLKYLLFLVPWLWRMNLQWICDISPIGGDSWQSTWRYMPHRNCVAKRKSWYITKMACVMMTKCTCHTHIGWNQPTQSFTWWMNA